MAIQNVNRRYVIFNITELSKIDFSQVFETSAETIRRSVDGTKSFVKFDIKLVDVADYIQNEEIDSPSQVEPIIEVQLPSSIASLSTKSPLYVHSDFKQILNSADWVDKSSLYK